MHAIAEHRRRESSAVEVDVRRSCGCRRRSRADSSGCVRASRAKPSISSGTWRRLKIEPTKSTVGRRRAGHAIGCAARTCQVPRHPDRRRRSSRRSMPSCATISRFENCEIVITRVARARPAARTCGGAQPFAPGEPFRMGGKRHVVDGEHHRNRRQQRVRCSAGANSTSAPASRASVGSTICSHSVPARPGSCAPFGRAEGRTRAPAPRASSPCSEQLTEEAADAGRLVHEARARRSRSSSAARRFGGQVCSGAPGVRDRDGESRHQIRAVQCPRPIPSQVNVRARASPACAARVAHASSNDRALERVGERVDVDRDRPARPRRRRLRAAIRGGRDDRNARRHRFEHGKTEAFVERRHHEDARRIDTAPRARRRARSRGA